MRDLNGRTVLRRVLERCAAIQGASYVCCAVPYGAADDVVAEEALRCGAHVTRGSETDVLKRYYEAARELQADFILRVTSDCPLLDPHLATQVLALVTEASAEYACNNLPRVWPHGLDCEAFRYDWLERADREAALPSEREHVSPFIRNHPNIKRLVLPGPPESLAHHRWTLDTEADLIFLRAVFERMPEGLETYCYRYPLSVVENEPELIALNAPDALGVPPGQSQPNHCGV